MRTHFVCPGNYPQHNTTDNITWHSVVWHQYQYLISIPGSPGEHDILDTTQPQYVSTIPWSWSLDYFILRPPVSQDSVWYPVSAQVPMLAVVTLVVSGEVLLVTSVWTPWWQCSYRRWWHQQQWCQPWPQCLDHWRLYTAAWKLEWIWSKCWKLQDFILLIISWSNHIYHRNTC